MERFSFLANAGPEEVNYYVKLYEIASENNTKQIEGMHAVDFFK